MLEVRELVEGEEGIELGWSIDGHSLKRPASCRELRRVDGEGVQSGNRGG